MVQFIIVALALVVGFYLKSLHQDKIKVVYSPPSEIAKWYKPESKRHVFLHTMFSLRREMQAIEQYASEENKERLDSWMLRFEKHYKKIGLMVPSWSSKLDLPLLSQLKESVDRSEFSEVLTLSKKLKASCDSCHDKYQGITALIYRSPNFSGLTLSTGESFLSHMNKLTYLVNDIKISMEDRNVTNASSSLERLVGEMKLVGETCVNCHNNDAMEYPNDAILETTLHLEEQLKNGTLREQGRTLGTLAVQACATCHGTHKLSYGIKKDILRAKPFSEWHQ